ncbi:hypothetical protein RRG08_007105 [Elysia crispata]|uniref:Uncharacterized protein n=1 Tax=Elysia crispata TaxID=231223 RepID=A0AAE0YND7_9GAST|nr:hypothetical protein RRG08_007105 [Elysia crispata]
MRQLPTIPPLHGLEFHVMCSKTVENTGIEWDDTGYTSCISVTVMDDKGDPKHITRPERLGLTRILVDSRGVTQKQHF